MREQATEKRFVSPDLSDVFQHHYPEAFAASDMFAAILLPGLGFRKLGNLAALSISTHRDVFPVTSLARVGVQGFTQGHRTVAGTMIFHTLDRNALLYRVNNGVEDQTTLGHRSDRISLPDTFPLFDLHISYVNEAGALSFEALYGVRILDFGKTMSLENLHPVESYSYMAMEYDPMRAVVDQSQMPESRPFILNPPARTQDQKPLSVPGLSRPGGPPTSSVIDPELLPGHAFLAGIADIGLLNDPLSAEQERQSLDAFTDIFKRDFTP